MGALVLGQPLTAATITGGVLIVAAVMLLQRRPSS
jgi:drug/metabolite transporter (DMT)-like permease